MKYDFTSIMERSGKDAVAVDGPGHDPNAPGLPKDGFDFIPMWVADMNFPTVPAVPKAVIARANHPAYGYFDISDDYYDAIIRWHETRNGITGLCKEHIGYENGVLGGGISALGSYASPGDAVLLHSPAYIGFTECLTQNGYRIIRSELKKDAQGVFRMDYTDMEDKIKAHHIHVAIICSPHNPSGRVWERRELEQAMKIFEENEVIVISDEIWSDILLNGSKHIPTQSVSAYAHEHTAAFYAPSKTFNLAGLIGSYHIIYNRSLRDRITSKGEKTHYNSINVLSMHALIGAYSPDGQEWTDELCQTLSTNVAYACDFISAHFAHISVSRPQGTYMLFLDCTDWCRIHQQTIDQLLQAGWDVGVGWQDGRPFYGPCHIRMNLALPLSRVKDAFERLSRYVFSSSSSV
ncbi:MAG: aminotransferase class I/II-fold pyridoxal phosphate-dependent enzyme [Eubacterium sp.]|nr:aminotransferase class I/II-fold pyridoxal phosphate-dependent enzyme [Eubacterium sp.]